ncbi:hypothetical protein [Streptomyces mirabilis]|uniref:hypothetical protein n=1 Tax=Streptomyces mirabilis TaxID=68239 RepID=UPI003821B831
MAGTSRWRTRSALADYLMGAHVEAARDFAESAIAHAGTRADNATVLVADLCSTG